MTQYHISEKKRIAREETIIKPYHQLYNRRVLPRNKQYWTLSALCSDAKGNYLQGCELHHMIKSGLISPEQFHGVDNDPKIVNKNKHLQLSNWYCGDFFNVLSQAKDFNPAIINYDSTSCPELASVTLADILALCTNQNISDVMVVGNICVKIRYRSYTIQDVADHLCTTDLFRHVVNMGNWSCLPKQYVYSGSGKNVTKMCSVVFYK